MGQIIPQIGVLTIFICSQIHNNGHSKEGLSLLPVVWDFNWGDSTAGAGINTGIFTHKSIPWAGRSGKIVQTDQKHLHVASACVLGFLTAWQAQSIWTCYRATLSSKQEVPVNKAEDASPPYDPASEVTEGHFCQIQLVKAATSLPRLKGRGHRSQLLMVRVGVMF